MTDKAADSTRAIRQEATVAAPLDAVWQALTEAEELKRWFPLDAKVTPGPSGSVSVSWGGDEWTVRIDVWRPNKHLRLVSEMPGAEGEGGTMAIDYHLATEAGETVVRLVHSGFGASSDWDDMYDGTAAGWAYFLVNLRFYLERHRGTPRDMVWTRITVPGDPTVTWDRVFGPQAFSLAPAGPGPVIGDQVSLAWGDERYEATVATLYPGRAMSFRIRALNDALLFLELEGGGTDRTLGVWLSTYGMPAARVARLREAIPAIERAIAS